MTDANPYTARLVRHRALAEDGPALLRRSAAGELIVEVAQRGDGLWPDRVAVPSRCAGWLLGDDIGRTQTHGPGRPSTKLCALSRPLTEDELDALDDAWVMLDTTLDDWRDLHALTECSLCGYHGIVTLAAHPLCRMCMSEIAESAV